MARSRVLGHPRRIHVLTIWCRYPDDDEVTSVGYGFATESDAELAQDAVFELVQGGGEFYLADCDGRGPMPFHAETVWGVTVRASS